MNIRRNLARNSGYRQSSSRATTYRHSRYRSYRRPQAVRVVERAPVVSGHPEAARMVESDASNSEEPSSAQPEAVGEARNQAPDQPGVPVGTAGMDNAPSAAPGNAGAPTEDESTQDLAPEIAPRGQEATEEASLLIPHGAMPAPLRGSLESLERQNTKLDAEGLERIEDESDLAARIDSGLLVPVPVSNALTINGDLPLNHRYCRPWTAHFLADLARQHAAAFHRPFEVSSAVRTVEYQHHLMRVNGNAAPAEGDIVSPHLTGATIDIAKHGMSRQELGWMRNRLLALEAEGKIDVEEEFRQSCFHITVYKSYDPLRSMPKPSEAKEPSDAPQAAPVADGDPSTTGF